MTRTSTSPSLSMSPNAAPRLECGVTSPRPPALTHVVEAEAEPVAEEDARAAVRVVRQRALDLGIDVAGDVEEIDEAVVVEVAQAGSPLHVAILRVETGGDRGVFEESLAEVAVERRNVVREVGLGEIEHGRRRCSRRPRHPCRPAGCPARCRPCRSRRAMSVNVPSWLLR